MEDDNFNLDFLDYDFANDNTIPSLLSWLNQPDDEEIVQHNFLSSVSSLLSVDGIDVAMEYTRKRPRSETCCKTEVKAIREKLRRERINEKFVELSSVMDPGRPVRSDKLAILADAIQLLKQLKTEAQKLDEANKTLNEEIKNIKAEKNELREEKIALKADKERIEHQLKMISLMRPHPASYHPMASKITPIFPGFGMVPIPMWQYLPPAAADTSKDHELRPPAA